MALSNLYGWKVSMKASASCGTACGASDKAEKKPAAACGTACGASDR